MTPDEREKYLDKAPRAQGRPLYYHRNGTPVKTNREMVSVFAGMHSDPDSGDYFRVAQTRGRGRRKELRVSTVFLAIDHSFAIHPGGPPLIFESMVFRRDKGDVDIDRYSTELEAIDGHYRMVRKWLGWHAARRFMRTTGWDE